MRKKSATSGKPASVPTISPSKAMAVSGLGDPNPFGKLAPAEAIRVRAYEKWEAGERPQGNDARFWRAAERELSQSD